MPHTYPIIEVQQIMRASEDDLQSMLKSTPYALQSNGVLQVFGQSKHIPHIKIQIFLALMRLGQLSHISQIQLQPYLFALLMLHRKWLEPLRDQFFQKQLGIRDFTSKYELSLYLKMGGGTHWTKLEDSDLALLPDDLSSLTGVQSCYITKHWSQVERKIRTLPNPFSLHYFFEKRKKETIQLSSLLCHRATIYNAKIVGSIPISLTELSIPFSDISSTIQDVQNKENVQILDLSFSTIDQNTLLVLLQEATNLHTLYVCGTPNLHVLPQIVQERNIKVYAFASSCCTPDSQYDQKIRKLLFANDVESQTQGKEILESLGLGNTTSTVKIENGTYQSSSLYEGFQHCQKTISKISFSDYTMRQYIWNKIRKHLCFGCDPSLFQDWSWQKSIETLLNDK